MVKEIVCNTGDIALCDDEDYPLLSGFSWFLGSAVDKGHPYPYCGFYGRGNVQKKIPMHQMVTGGIYNLDYIDNNSFNNQKLNLRESTHQENGWNKGKPKGGRFGAPSSQFKGVIRCVANDGSVNYRVIIKLTKKDKKPARHARLGPFQTEIEAARAYNAEIVKHRGKWAWLNPIPSAFSDTTATK